MDITEEDIKEFLDALDGRKCEICGEYKDDVSYEECPSPEDENEDILIWICDICYQDQWL